ncbi:DSPTP1 [Symbiodinium necroappetens]|uniref:DSPTP1 protein n=1 Tax=Symbiodinium necroappetens TaxID=1628268 RepID=A0A813ATE2_9DINO|nr:DSPTP1 [Symbiodinium necroappetens]
MERRHRQNAQNIAEMECKAFAFLIGPMLAFAALNLVDFVTDILVLLKLSCVTNSSIRQECEYSNFTCKDGLCSYANVTYTAGQSEDKCVAHAAWSGFGCVILLGSSVASAVAYRPSLRVEPSRKSIWCGFVAAFFQIAPLLDIMRVVRTGKLEEKRRQQMMRRDFVLKLAESVPQAFLQSYIMFASATHVEPLNLLSVTTSVTSVSLSLALQLPKIVLPTNAEASEAFKAASEVAGHAQTYGVQEEEVQVSADDPYMGHDVPSEHPKDPKDAGKSQQGGELSRVSLVLSPLNELVSCKATFIAYLASDLVLRCGAYAMLLSPFARHLGFAGILGFAVCQSVAGYRSAWRWLLRGKLLPCLRGCIDVDKNVPEVPTSILGLACSLSLSFVIGFALAYSITFVGSSPLQFGFLLLALPALVLSAVPVVVTFERPCRDKACFIGVRLLEYLSFGILLSANGRTFCGKPLGREPIAFFAVLGLNLVALLLHLSCKFPFVPHSRTENQSQLPRLFER